MDASYPDLTPGFGIVRHIYTSFLGCAVAFARPRGTLGVMTINHEKPPIEVQVMVWVGLATLLAAAGAFMWLFVLGHGFNF